MVSHWSLSDTRSPQVSWTLFGILADLNNASSLDRLHLSPHFKVSVVSFVD